MSRRQRAKKRRLYREWCQAWFKLPYDPRPNKFGHVTWQYPIKPKFHMTFNSLVVQQLDVLPMSDMDNTEPHKPTRWEYDFVEGTVKIS